MHQEGHPAWLAPARGLLLAALATLLATTGHVVGGGSLDDLSPFAVLVPMLATVMVAVAERCRGIVAMLAALGAGQAGLHAVLGVLTAHTITSAGPSCLRRRWSLPTPSRRSSSRPCCGMRTRRSER